ncbi:MAG: hypothetical protein QM831_27335 [Kofleriaceae bacterium]
MRREREIELERAGDQIVDRAIERRIDELFDHRTEHVERERVVPRVAGLRDQRDGRETAQVFGERETRLIEPIGHVRLVIRATGRFHEPIREATRVRQQLMDRDRRKCRQKAIERGVERQA